MKLEIEFPDYVNRFKAHVGRHKTAYIVGSLVVVAGVTYLVTRKLSSGTANDNVNVRAFNFLSNHPSIVTVIENGRQGPPSWVVRCLETGEIFTSQRMAALLNGINQSDLSQHLNGLHENVKGLHFDRICIAA